MASNYYVPTAPTNCDPNALLAVTDTDCAVVANLELSEIETLYYDLPDAAGSSVPRNPITGWVSAGLDADDTVNATAINTWLSNVDNAVAGSVHYMKVIGDKPDPEESTITLPGQKTAVASRKHPYNIDIVQLDQIIREQVRSWQYGGTIIIWFKTIGGGFYGGINGICVDILNAKLPLGRGENVFANGNLVFQNTHLIDPPREAFPG